jgi:hypothetical protein
VAEVFGRVLAGVAGGEGLDVQDHLLVGEVVVEAVGGEDHEPVLGPELVVPEVGAAADVRRGPDVVHLEHLEERLVPPGLFQVAGSERPRHFQRALHPAVHDAGRVVEVLALDPPHLLMIICIYLFLPPKVLLY